VSDLLRHPWFRVLLVATSIAAVCWAIRETAIITLPIAHALAEVALPLAIGFTIAYVLTPLVDALDRRGLHRWPATLVLFLVFGGAAVVTAILVVPAVVRQSSALAARLFQAEPFIDQDRDQRWDEGEPFEDRNGDGRYDDSGLLAEWGSWARQQQDWVRHRLKLGLTPQALAFLDLYAQRTRGEREALSQGLDAARERLPAERWPSGFAVIDPDLGADWDPSWPGPDADDIAAGADRLPPPNGLAWRAHMIAHGARLAEEQRLLISALKLSRAGGVAGDPALDELAGRVRAAMQTAPDETAARAARDIADRLVDESRRGQALSSDLLAELGGAGDEGGRVFGTMLEAAEAQMQSEIETAPARIAEWIKGGLSSLGRVLSGTLSLVLIPVYAFFLTLAMPGIRATVRKYVPMRGRARTFRLMHDIERVVAAFFRGRLIVCAACAALTYAGFVIIGVPYAALFAILIGLATAVPFAGLIFLVPAVALHLADGHSALSACFVVAVYGLVQALETVALTPMIMGREVELHPVTLIIALLLCGKLLGILGLILAVPIAATVRILAREFLLPRLRGLAELPPQTVLVGRAASDAPATTAP